MRRGRALLFAGGAALGIAAGWRLAQRSLEHNRAALFSPRPLRRLAALGYLAGEPSVETAVLLRDYVAWERRPALRRRAEAMLRRLEVTLG
jgi:hypothetical protein